MTSEKERFVAMKQRHTIRLTDTKLAIDVNRGVLSRLESFVEGHGSLSRTIGWALRFAYPEDIRLNRVMEAYVNPDGFAEIVRKTALGNRRIRIPDLTGDEARRLVDQIAAMRNQRDHRRELLRSTAKALRVQFVKNEWILAIFAILIVWEAVVLMLSIPVEAMPAPSGVVRSGAISMVLWLVILLNAILRKLSAKLWAPTRLRIWWEEQKGRVSGV